jgi:hypothetical protein
MKYFRYIIIYGFLVGFLVACRSKLDTSRQESQRHVDEIGVVLRRLDSLGSTIAERQHIKVEFYPLEYGWPNPTTKTTDMDTAAMIGPSQWSAHCADGGGFGLVKSIEIVTERDATTTATSAVDSTSVFKTEQEATLQKQKASETRQDNGTIAIVSVVAAVVVLLALLIIIKKLLKR